MPQSTVCQRHKTPPDMWNFTRLALQISRKKNKKKRSTKLWCCWESLAHELFVCHRLCTVGTEKTNLPEQHKNTGHGRLEEADLLSGITYQELTFTKTVFEFSEKFYQKKPANRARAQHCQTTGLCRKKKNLAFDILCCGLISRK